MFKSEPICILKAGFTVDGREVRQKDIDDIVETYDPKLYNARINDDHNRWSWKGGSVLSVEKRERENGDEVWAVLKPNSHLLRNIEMGQLLHTSCELERDFSKTGKTYLIGLALTDEPASLGTTEMHLSRQNSELMNCGLSIGSALQDDDESDRSLFQKFKTWLSGENSAKPETFSQQPKEDEMSKKTEELLEKSIEQTQELNTSVMALVELFSKQTPPEGPEGEVPPQGDDPVAKLTETVEQLSASMTDMTEKLSRLSDEPPRDPAGTREEPDYL